MKRSIFTLLYVAISLCVMAASPRLSRSQFKNVTVTTDRIDNGSAVTTGDGSQSLQQFLLDSRLNSPSLQPGLNSDDTVGTRIASADLYNFDWDDESRTVVVNESEPALMGRYCKIKGSSLTAFYGDFTIPIDIDTITGAVTIEAGKLLSTIDETEYDSEHGPLTRIWKLYAMPLSWLTGDDDYDDIHGQVQEDGIITFSDDFAFLVEYTSYSGEFYFSVPRKLEMSWGLSPIYRDLKFLLPNGRHTFKYTRPSTDDGLIIPEEWGTGGLVPRKPGQSKPVSAPRMFGEIIEKANPCIGDNAGVESSDRNWIPPISVVTTNEDVPVYMYMEDELTMMVYNLFGLGNRCSIKVQELNGTIDLRTQQIYNDGLDSVLYNTPCSGVWYQNNLMWGATRMFEYNPVLELIPIRTFDSNRLYFTDGSSSYEIPEPVFTEPMVTDSTVVFRATTTLPVGVVQLYRYDEDGQIYDWAENPLTLPRLNQSYLVSLAACTYDTIRSGYSPEVFFEYEIPARMLPDPVFEEPIITDTTVTFRVTTVESDSIEVYLSKYDEQEDGYIEVDNPLSVPRRDEPYWLYLAAQAYNPVDDMCSNPVWLEFEVPQLGLSCLRGDANTDGSVNITDAILLINALLNEDFESIYRYNADVNRDSNITISDVIALINYLHSGLW